ncbi:MAG: acetate/propionate family kinase [Rhodocyclaceae bacterium]|nr:acetate/propionate family kinase [Rhodocyclaceae bacterium]
MSDLILVLNAGSSSIKFALYDADDEPRLRLKGQVEGIGVAARFVARDAHGNSLGEQRWMDGIQPDHELATEFLLHWLRAEVSDGRLIGVGHRVVHGGTRFSVPARIDSDVADYLSRLVPLAPLHQPHNLAPIRRIAQQAGAPPQVACFDTAFHRTQPEVAQALPLPREITDRGVRRYGFHGLSYEYIASQLPAIDARAARGRTVVAHLGNGASLCGMVNGCSMASTMGFTALEGLMMGTRTGSIDPGVILYLFDTLHMNVHDVTALLYKRSGLLGVSGISSDMRVLGASENIHAREAIDLFVYRVVREIGSMAAAIGGMDALVFTAGIGENDAGLREAVCRGCAWLGLDLDEQANAAHDQRITLGSSRVSAWVIPTDEELMVARHTRSLLRT